MIGYIYNIYGAIDLSLPWLDGSILDDEGCV